MRTVNSIYEISRWAKTLNIYIWLQPDIDIESFCSLGYLIYRVDRSQNRIGGGSLLLIAQQNNQRQRLSLNSTSVQVSSCTVAVGHVKVFVANVYRCPSSTNIEDADLLAFLEGLLVSATKLLILGDFNAPEINWTLDAAPSNSFGHLLLKFLWNNNLVQHVDQHTRRRADHTPSTLDLIITKFPNDIRALELKAPLGKSDHSLINFKFDIEGLKPPDKYRRSYRKLNKVDLKEAASNLLWECDSDRDVELKWSRIKVNLMRLTEKFAPLRKVKRKGRPPWWTAKIIRSMKRKAGAWKRYCKSNSYIMYIMYLEYKRSVTILTIFIRKCRSNYKKRLSTNAKVNPKAFHNYVQSKAALRGFVGDLKDSVGKIAMNKDDEANVLLRFFESVHREDSGKAPLSISKRSSPVMENPRFSDLEVQAC